MTARQLYEYALIEINKVEAPSLLLQDFIYFINKAVINYVNKRYNVYDINEQSSNDLRVLKGEVTLTSLTPKTGNKLQGAVYVGQLPQDYFHITDCVVEFKLTKAVGCNPVSEPLFKGAKRLTSDKFSGIINNYYHKPSWKNPYYYIHNAIAPVIDANGIRVKGDRDGNASPVQLEIRYGKDNSTFVLERVFVEYLKVPQYISITEGEIEQDTDTSQVIEFPNYVCYEILKELVALLMENSSDPRLQTNIPVNQTIAPPAQGQASR